jgi:hypothetical protein
MKKASLILSVLIAAFLLQAHSCHKDKRDYPSVCGNPVCTEIFKAVMVTVKDSNGDPVKLDESYTIRLYNDEIISGPGGNPDQGTYVVVDDNFISSLMNKTEGFRFIGKKNGVTVVDEVYQVTGDCCHVNKDTGKDEVIIP